MYVTLTSEMFTYVHQRSRDKSYLNVCLSVVSRVGNTNDHEYKVPYLYSWSLVTRSRMCICLFITGGVRGRTKYDETSHKAG